MPEEGDLIVNAMVRLVSNIAASGDRDLGAAPVGRIPARAWAEFPALGLGVTFVQVELCAEIEGARAGWIIFRESALRV